MRLLLFLLAIMTVFGAQRSDSEIEADMRARLSRSKLAADGIQIKVQKGVATLTGHVGIVQHKGTATRMAKSSGATEVVNRIQISESAKKAAVERLAKGRAAASTAHATTPKSPAPATSSAPVSVPPPVRRAQVQH